MEVNRSLLSALIGFYLCLNGPDLKDIADAMELWKNRFAHADHVAIETLIAAFFKTRELDLNSLRDKNTALVEIGRYIRNLDRKLQRFRNASQNSVRCSRAEVPISAEMTTLTDDFTRFVEDFDDTTTHENRCWVRRFFLERHKHPTNSFVTAACSKPVPRREARGFEKIGENLDKIIKTNGGACSCLMCCAIGDAVIALDAPRNQRLEHTDYSFNYLCPPIDQPHCMHPSAMGINRPQNV
jgi:hypothetical protein